VEGVCVQTHAVLRQAWAERMKPCLVLNKMDRLASELQLDPHETWHRLRRTVERVNALAAALVANLAAKTLDAAKTHDEESGKGPASQSDSREKAREDLEAEWTFSPEKGNVVFASAVDGWAFSINDFARIWSPRIPGSRPSALRHFLWADFAFNPKTGKIAKLRQGGDIQSLQPMFVALVLDPIWQLYAASGRRSVRTWAPS